MPAHRRSKNGVASLAYVAGIHVFFPGELETWMAGTSPAMTCTKGLAVRRGAFLFAASGMKMRSWLRYHATMLFDLPLRCRCGRVRGIAHKASPSGGFRFVCYCTDCQAFARILGRPDVLDAAGGTDIFHMPAGRVMLTAGANALRCVTFSGKVLRWYADCCRAPIANTAATARFPVVALIHSFLGCDDCRPLIPAQAGIQAASADISANPLGPRIRGDERIMRDQVIGPPLCRIYERSAIGPLPPDAPPPPSIGMFARRGSKVLGWWLRGLGRPNPFFDERTGAPLAVPCVVPPSERVVL